jgi:hypothetical protein
MSEQATILAGVATYYQDSCAHSWHQGDGSINVNLIVVRVSHLLTGSDYVSA